jgi:hypothetical protein
MVADVGVGPEATVALPVPESVKLLGTTEIAEAVPPLVTVIVTVIVPPILTVVVAESEPVSEATVAVATPRELLVPV